MSFTFHGKSSSVDRWPEESDRAEALDEANARFEGRPPLEILEWAAATYADRVTFGTGFGVEGCMLVHLIATARLPIDIYTLDTGLLFRETYDLWRQLERRYGVTIRAVRPEQTVAEQEAAYGPALWARRPDLCCALRKLAPQRAALRGYDAWISAIRRDQTPDRARARIVEHDARFEVVKINPLLTWTADDVWRFVIENGVPYNPLHDRQYPSIGCFPCTTPVAPGEDPRRGRWRGLDKQECGLHSRLAGSALAVEE